MREPHINAFVLIVLTTLDFQFYYKILLKVSFPELCAPELSPQREK